MNKEEFKRVRTEKLVAKIKEIIGSTKSDSEKSIEIMSCIRNEYIYVDKFTVPSTKVTIDPDSENVKFELENGDIESLKDNEFTKIYADSFGPFNPEAYFKNDQKYRVVWLLKEPFIETDNDQGGHDQAKEYNTPDEFYSTHRKAIEYTQILLLKLQGEEKKIFPESVFAQEDLSDLNTIMKHICILEVNHFPGLDLKPEDIKSKEPKSEKKSSKTDDDIIRKWSDLNADLLGELVEFYKPDIICAGFVLQHFTFKFIRNKDSYTRVEKRDWNDIQQLIDNGVLYIKFGNLLLHVNIGSRHGNYVYMVNGNKPIYLIDAYHPSSPLFEPKNDASKDADSINQWIKSNNKGS